jgi:hypothetical protein
MPPDLVFKSRREQTVTSQEAKDQEIKKLVQVPSDLLTSRSS